MRRLWRSDFPPGGNRCVDDNTFPVYGREAARAVSVASTNQGEGQVETCLTTDPSVREAPNVDAKRFDGFARSFTIRAARRAALRGVVGAAFTAFLTPFGAEEAGARRKKKKKKKVNAPPASPPPASPPPPPPPEPPCVPNCTGTACAGDGCGGTCTCSTPATCVAGVCNCPAGFPTCGSNGVCCDRNSQVCSGTTCVGCNRVGDPCNQTADCCQPVQGQNTLICSDVPGSPSQPICCRRPGEGCLLAEPGLCCSGACAPFGVGSTGTCQ